MDSLGMVKGENRKARKMKTASTSLSRKGQNGFSSSSALPVFVSATGAGALAGTAVSPEATAERVGSPGRCGGSVSLIAAAPLHNALAMRRRAGNGR